MGSDAVSVFAGAASHTTSCSPGGMYRPGGSIQHKPTCHFSIFLWEGESVSQLER